MKPGAHVTRWKSMVPNVQSLSEDGYNTKVTPPNRTREKLERSVAPACCG
jgi:hypothetical protein